MLNIEQYGLPVTALTSLCVGLSALGFDISKMLNLGNLRKPLQLVAGIAGAHCLFKWFNRPVMTTQMEAINWFIVAAVATSVGLAALGFDVSKMLKLGSLRKPLQYVAGVAGALTLAAYFGLMA